MNAVDNDITWENFEKYCDGVSIHKRFGVLCSELFKASNGSVSISLKERSFSDFNFCYSNGLISFYYFQPIEKLEDKVVKRIVDELASAHEGSDNCCTFFFNQYSEKLIDLLMQQTKSIGVFALFVCDNEILNLVRSSSCFLKNYFFSKVGLSQKWFYYHIKRVFESYIIRGTVQEKEINDTLKRARLIMNDDGCRTIGGLLSQFISGDERYLWVDSAVDRWTSLKFANDIVEKGGICIHIDTDRFKEGRDLAGQISDALGLGISWECFLDYVHYYSAEHHNTPLLVIFRGRKVPKSLIPFLK